MFGLHQRHSPLDDVRDLLGEAERRMSRLAHEAGVQTGLRSRSPLGSMWETASHALDSMGRRSWWSGTDRRLMRAGQDAFDAVSHRPVVTVLAVVAGIGLLAAMVGRR